MIHVIDRETDIPIQELIEFLQLAQNSGKKKVDISVDMSSGDWGGVDGITLTTR